MGNPAPPDRIDAPDAKPQPPSGAVTRGVRTGLQTAARALWESAEPVLGVRERREDLVGAGESGPSSRVRPERGRRRLRGHYPPPDRHSRLLMRVCAIPPPPLVALRKSPQPLYPCGLCRCGAPRRRGTGRTRPETDRGGSPSAWSRSPGGSFAGGTRETRRRWSRTFSPARQRPEPNYNLTIAPGLVKRSAASKEKSSDSGAFL